MPHEGLGYQPCGDGSFAPHQPEPMTEPGALKGDTVRIMALPCALDRLDASQQLRRLGVSAGINPGLTELVSTYEGVEGALRGNRDAVQRRVRDLMMALKGLPPAQGGFCAPFASDNPEVDLRVQRLRLYRRQLAHRHAGPRPVLALHGSDRDAPLRGRGLADDARRRLHLQRDVVARGVHGRPAGHGRGDAGTLLLPRPRRPRLGPVRQLRGLALARMAQVQGRRRARGRGSAPARTAASTTSCRTTC